MLVNIVVVFFIAIATMALGFMAAWNVRKERIEGLERKLRAFQQDMIQYEMEYGNLEAYKQHIQKEKDAMDTELEQMKNIMLEERTARKETETVQRATLDEIDEHNREIAKQKQKINDLHVKTSELTINLKKARDAKNNWKIKHDQLLQKNKEIIAEQTSLKQNLSHIAPAVAQQNSSKYPVTELPIVNVENKRQQALESVMARADELSFEHIGKPYSQHNLKEINGIGVLLEKKLYALNITSLAQIASLTAKDILKINDILGLPQDKIQKDNWTKQASQLLGTEGIKINLTKKLSTIASMRKYINPAKETFGGNERNLEEINTLTPLDMLKLNALGVYNVTQVANFTETDVKNVTNILGLMEGRVKNEYWLEQAKDFLEENQLATDTATQQTDYQKTIEETTKIPQEAIN